MNDKKSQVKESICDLQNQIHDLQNKIKMQKKECEKSDSDDEMVNRSMNGVGCALKEGYQNDEMMKFMYDEKCENDQKEVYLHQKLFSKTNSNNMGSFQDSSKRNNQSKRKNQIQEQQMQSSNISENKKSCFFQNSKQKMNVVINSSS